MLDENQQARARAFHWLCEAASQDPFVAAARARYVSVGDTSYEVCLEQLVNAMDQRHEQMTRALVAAEERGLRVLMADAAKKEVA